MATILVVDDEPDVCELIEKYLSKLGYAVMTALNGEQALEKLQEGKPALVLLDIRMPGIDGIEVLRRIRVNNKNLPVIMTTAVAEENARRQAFNLGASRWITKPINLKSLKDNITSAINQTS